MEGGQGDADAHDHIMHVLDYYTVHRSIYCVYCRSYSIARCGAMKWNNYVTISALFIIGLGPL